MSSASAYVALLRTVQALARRNDANLWPELLTSAVRVVPGAEGGSILIRSKNHYEVVTGQGYPSELKLVGSRLPLEAAVTWYGDPDSWKQGQPRIISGPVLKQTIERGAAIVGDNPASRAMSAELNKLQANLCLPIVLEGELVAYINLDNRSDPNAFSPESVVIAQQYVLQVTALLSVQRERLAQEARLREFETIASLSKAFQSSLALEEIVTQLAAEVSRLMDAPNLSIFLLDASGQALENKLSIGFFAEMQGISIPRGTGLSWAALEAGQILHIPNVGKDSRTYEPRPGQRPAPHAQLTTPFFDSTGQPLGVMHVTRRLPQQFNPSEIRLMEVISSIAATALERGIAAARLEQQLREFEVIATLSKTLQSSLGLDEIVQRLGNEITRLVHSPHISIFLINEEKNGLENRLALGHFSEIVGLFIPKGQGLSWAALEEHRILHIPDLFTDPRTFDPRANQPSKSYTQISTPLFDSAGKPLGVIHISRPLPGRFSEQEVRLMELIGSIAATALERGIAAAHLERQLRELEVIARLSEALRTSTGLRTTAERLGREISHLMDSPHVDILLINDGQTQLESLISLGLFARFQDTVVPKGAGLSWTSLNENRILYIPDVHADARTYNPTPELSPAHAQLTTPLFNAAGQPLGVIHAARNLPRSFSASDIRLMEIIGNFAATALERARSAARLEVQLRESQTLLKTVRILATGDQEEVWQELLEAAVELVPGSEGGSLWIRQDDLLVMMAQQGFSNVLLGQSFPINTFMLWSSNGERWSSGQPAIRRRSFLEQSADLPEYYISEEQQELFNLYGRTDDLQCTVSIPIRQGDQIIAHIDLDNFSDENALDERSIEVGRRFALQVGALLAAQRQNIEREAAFEGALRAIGVALEGRDLETAGHTDRVATLAVRLGQQLGLSEGELRELRWGAYLHDMGKLMIPDTILLKPAKLTPEEFTVMKTHAYTGYQLSQNLPFLPESVRQVIHHHHERWDGSGYPAGLGSEEIPLMARIFSVCDVFDALTSSRPYKPAWPLKDALEEITRQSGKQFDPQVVEVCLEVMASLEAQVLRAKS